METVPLPSQSKMRKALSTKKGWNERVDLRDKLHIGWYTYIFRGHDLLELRQGELVLVFGQVLSEDVLQVLEVFGRQLRPISRRNNILIIGSSSKWSDRISPGIAYVQDKVHHLVNRDRPVAIGVGQPEDGGRHPAIAKDLVEGGGGDGVILADEIGDGLQELDDVDAVRLIAPENVELIFGVKSANWHPTWIFMSWALIVFNIPRIFLEQSDPILLDQGASVLVVE